MKRVLIISEAFWSSTKGTAQYTLNLINELKNELDIHVLVPEFNDNSSYKISDVTLHSCFVDVDSKQGLLNSNARKKFINYVEENLLKICIAYKIDCVHIVYGHFVIKSIPSNLKVPVIWTCHNMPPNESHPPFNKGDLISKLGNFLYKKMVRLKHAYLINSSNIDRVICISEATKLDLKKWLLTNKIDVIGNGCNLSEKIERVNSRGLLNIITVGGIKPHKNIHLIPSISARLNEIGLKHRWVVIGPSMNEAYTEHIRVINEQCDSSVLFKGAVDLNDLKKAYADSDLYVHLSKEEGFCLTILEAAGFGLPSIGTNVGAIPEILRNLNCGLLVEPYELEICSAIIKFHQERDLYNSSNVLINKVTDNWSWKKVALKHIEYYNRFC
ncbi:TPA: glycosyltransferase family 4 protein [Aeromonas hydrophila]|uniref:glycosyltransferase family 4 protein n=1 Tax=Aeromonas hydrophila TaxID=644 RepID=UPI0021E70A72|nr:glycosyltransferase family 4 protein [Aeromonas hydrophila]MCV3293488.1 glycosyltransferase family 4 protein [Aeromonas hydrophila]